MSDPLGIMPPRRDPVAAAVAATGGKAQQVQMLQPEATLPTGRPVAIAVPADISALEVLAFTGWIGSVLAKRIANRPKSRLVVPGR